jgi:Reversibly glycosylated polypeptide
VTYRDRRVCAWTPYGREISASILFRYLQREHELGMLDEWLLCLNVYDGNDAAYADRLAAEHDWITLWEIPGTPRPEQIAGFYALLDDPETVYVRFDDDIVYVHDQAIRRMIDATSREGILAAFPVIINNAVVSWHLQDEKKIPLDHGIIQSPECLDPVGCMDPGFAGALHDHVLGLLEAGTPERLFLESPVTLRPDQRISVSSFAIPGGDFPGLSGYPHGEEVWMTQAFPGITGKRNVIVHDALVSHYSFHYTRDYLMTTDIMSRYAALAEQLCVLSARMGSMDITVVIATVREHSVRQWLAEWEDDLKDARVIVIEDSDPGTDPEARFVLDTGAYRNLSHHARADIERDLGGKSWIIPRRSSACKSYGFLKAFREGAGAIWTLDDDCYPEEGWKGHYLPLLEKRLVRELPSPGWYNTIGETGLHPRGFPYGIREEKHPVMIHHGLWSWIPDLDGITAREYPDFRMLPAVGTEVVPPGFFPMCGMNLAFRREMTPAMYFMLMGQDTDGNHWGFDRFDDIWAGLFAKRICDHLGYAVTSGSPGIRHTKESDPDERVRKEATGIKAHEKFWQQVAYPDLNGCLTVAECYQELAEAVAEEIIPGWASYWRQLSRAMQIWLELCAA